MKYVKCKDCKKVVGTEMWVISIDILGNRWFKAINRRPMSLNEGQ